MAERDFRCVQGCSDCCTYREYYPTERFGKIGVLLLPDEVGRMREQAMKKGVKVRILPRIATGRQLPDRIVAYQMMGKNEDGDVCPFLDIDSGNRSPHGGLACRIYDDRPLACRAYPLLDSPNPTLDGHCKFCKEHSTTTANGKSMAAEIEALDEIKQAMQIPDNSMRVWRYATAAGRPEDRDKMLTEGWVIED
jgi:uncharacterized protein